MGLITIKLMGGLGNQLFQIFALIALAIKTNKKFILPAGTINYGQPRPTYWDTLFLCALREFISDAATDSTIPLLRHEQHHYIDIPTPTTTDSFCLYGYFQSPKYFIEQETEIIRLLRIRETIAAVAKKYSEQLGGENNVAIHFRTSDYKHIQHSHPVLSPNYYDEAIGKLIADNSGDSLRFLIFYEEVDKGLVMNLLNSIPSLRGKQITLLPPHIPDWCQLCIMATCKHHIIANSTFSWWGAYLAKYQPNYNPDNAHVFYPAAWFGPRLAHNSIADMFPAEWHPV